MRSATYLAEQETPVGAVVAEQIYDLAACLQASGQEAAQQAASVRTYLLGGGPDALAQANAAVTWARAKVIPL